MVTDVLALNLGCGPHVMSGWKNYDIEPGRGGIKYDLRYGLPHKTNTVDYIFSEHFLEHLSYRDAKNLLIECYRVLRPGGVLRLITPDLAVLTADYLQGHITRWAEIWQPGTPAQMLNEGMREWGHQFVFDIGELHRILTFELPFSQFIVVPHRVSRHAPLNGIDIRPDLGSDIRIEVTK